MQNSIWITSPIIAKGSHCGWSPPNREYNPGMCCLPAGSGCWPKLDSEGLGRRQRTPCAANQRRNLKYCPSSIIKVEGAKSTEESQSNCHPATLLPGCPIVYQPTTQINHLNRDFGSPIGSIYGSKHTERHRGDISRGSNPTAREVHALGYEWELRRGHILGSPWPRGSNGTELRSKKSPTQASF